MATNVVSVFTTASPTRRMFWSWRPKAPFMCLLLVVLAILHSAECFVLSSVGGLQIAKRAAIRRRGSEQSFSLRMKVEAQPTEFSFFDKATEETFRVKKMKPKSAGAFGSKPTAKKGKKKAAAASGGFAKKSVSLSPEWAACRSWIEKHGGKAEVDICEVAPGLRGAVATKALAKGEVVFSVPRAQCIMDERRADACDIAELWKRGGVSKWEGSGVSTDGYTPYTGAPPPPYAKTALLVLWLGRAEEAAGEWDAALRMLPSQADFDAEGGPLVLWEAEEVEAAQCSVLSRRAANRREAAEEQYARFVEERWHLCPALAALPRPTLQEYKCAVAVVTSRVYAGGAPGAEAMLIPGFDQANHHHPTRANTAKALAPWGDFVIVATKAIKKGAQVLSSYGPKDNRELLEQFGFMLPPDEDPDTPAEAQPVVDWLANLQLASPPSHEQLERLCDRQLLLRSSAGGPCSPVQPAGAGLEAACAELGLAYKDVIAAVLGGLPTSIEEDRGAVEQATLSPRQRLALQYRLRQKLALQSQL